jgi:hypothetical protein
MLPNFLTGGPLDAVRRQASSVEETIRETIETRP